MRWWVMGGWARFARRGQGPGIGVVWGLFPKGVTENRPGYFTQTPRHPQRTRPGIGVVWGLFPKGVTENRPGYFTQTPRHPQSPQRRQTNRLQQHSEFAAFRSG